MTRWRTILAVDFDRHACATYKANFPGIQVTRSDMGEISRVQFWRMAAEARQLGVPVAKPYPDAIAWGKMQPAKDSPIDFAKLDRVVRECQQAGFKELVIALKSASPPRLTDEPIPLIINPPLKYNS